MIANRKGNSGSLQTKTVDDAYGTPTVRDLYYNVRATGTAYDWQHLFTGQRQDLETGLYHYRNRQYHPALGTFVTRDPIGYDAGDMSLYCYVGGSPACRTDPDGRFWTAVCCAVCAATLTAEIALHYNSIAGCFSEPTWGDTANCLIKVINPLDMGDMEMCLEDCACDDNPQKYIDGCLLDEVLDRLLDTLTASSCICCGMGLPGLLESIPPLFSRPVPAIS